MSCNQELRMHLLRRVLLEQTGCKTEAEDKLNCENRNDKDQRMNILDFSHTTKTICTV